MTNTGTEKNYYRVMLGRPEFHLEQECYDGKYIGTGWFNVDLTDKLTDNWRDFHKNFGCEYCEGKWQPSKMTHRVCKGIKENDIVLCPNRKGLYWVGKVIGDYYYEKDGSLAHRRPVEWYGEIYKENMSSELYKRVCNRFTVIDITEHVNEIERLLFI